mgnify:CR=1 FL=1
MATIFEDWYDKAGDQWNAWFRSGGGGGEATEFGGLSAEDEAFKKMLYDRYGELPDEYESYTGDRFADKSPEEEALIKQMQDGHPMFDAASKNLGFSQDIYEDAAGYGVDELDKDAAALMSGDTYRNEVTENILRNLNRGASMSGMDIRGKANLGGTAFGDREFGQKELTNQNYLSTAGDALSKLNFGAYNNALNRARQLNLDRQNAAGRYGAGVLTNLGIGREKLGQRAGAFRDARAFQDRDLATKYKDWQDKQNFQYKKLGLGSSLFSGMPIEEKGMTQQPASGGK